MRTRNVTNQCHTKSTLLLEIWFFDYLKNQIFFFKKSSTKQSKNFLIILEGVWGSLPPKQEKIQSESTYKSWQVTHTNKSSICRWLICNWHVSHPFTSDMSLIYKWHANEICARYKISALQRAAWKTRLIHICDMTPWFVTVLSYCDMRIVSLLTLLSLLIVLNNCDIWIVSRDVFP